MRSRCLRLAACRFLRSELLLQPLLPAAAADLLSRYKPEHKSKYRQATCQRSLRPAGGTVPRVLHLTCTAIGRLRWPTGRTCSRVRVCGVCDSTECARVLLCLCLRARMVVSPSLPALACIGAVLSGVAQLYQRRARQPARPALAVFPLCARYMAGTLG